MLSLRNIKNHGMSLGSLTNARHIERNERIDMCIDMPTAKQSFQAIFMCLDIF